jgi:uncharacterized membrane protein YfcA
VRAAVIIWASLSSCSLSGLLSMAGLGAAFIFVPLFYWLGVPITITAVATAPGAPSTSEENAPGRHMPSAELALVSNK